MVPSNDEIWQRVCEGDADAWRTLVYRYEALVYTVARRAGLSVSDAEDCAQYTWWMLYRSRHHIKDPRGLTKWLIRTTRRRSWRMVQSAQRSQQAHDEIPDVKPTPLPDADLEQLERQADLEMAMLQLDERCRKLLHALFFEPQDKSYSDIAKELNIPANSIGPIRSRCLARLRKIMKQLGLS
ncbi:MAG TPA: sigma-70 family RNA polymerase sigma factor [candidate division Zixibacteria bacterium]|nr:sigma-70 family RNA polymerase sigma factor [candidate division Zixibacteria bacterium]